MGGAAAARGITAMQAAPTYLGLGEGGGALHATQQQGGACDTGVSELGGGQAGEGSGMPRGETLLGGGTTLLAL